MPVDFSLSHIPPSRADGRIFIEGSSWAQPKEQDFKDKLNQVLKNKRDYTKSAADLAVEVRKHFCQSKINEYYDNFLKEIINA